MDQKRITNESERLVVVAVARRRIRRALGRGGARRAARTFARSTTLVLGHLGGGPPQARSDLVRGHLDLGALVPVRGLPRTLVEASGHDDARPTRQALGRVLG